MDICPTMFSSNVTEFYAAGSVCTKSVYIYNLQWAGINPAKKTLCVSCKLRELLSAVQPAIISTAASTSQLAIPAAAKEDPCGGEENLGCGRTRPQIRACLSTRDATKSHSFFDRLARREVEGLISM